MIHNYNLQFLTGGYTKVDPSWTMDVNHQDHCYKLYLPTSGSASLIIEDHEYPVEPGYLYFFSGYRLDRQICQTSMEGYWLHLAPRSLQLHYILSQAIPFHHFPAESFEWAQDTLKEVVHIFLPFHEEDKLSQRLHPNLPNDVMCRLQSVLLFIIGNVLETIDQQKTEKKLEALLHLKEATDFMDQQFIKNPSLKEIADQVHLSPNHFHRLFTQAFGVTPHTYMLSLRMNLAKERLTYSSDRIKQIATEVGYENPFQFSKMFKRHVGMSPKAYRLHKPEI